MIEPLDDELATCVRAYRQLEQPAPAARAASWSAIAARLAHHPSPRPRGARWGALAAIAAALALCLGLAGALAHQFNSAPPVEAIHHSGSAPSHPLALPAPAARQPRPDVPAHSLAPAGPALDPLLQPDDSSHNTHDSLPHPSAPSAAPATPDPRTDASPGTHDSLPPPSDPSAAPAIPAPRTDASPGTHDSLPPFSDPSAAPATPDTGTDESAARPPTPRAISRTRPHPGGAPSLTPEEVTSFQRAQAALAEGRHADALAALDAHGRRFPGGFFEEERLVSRATALCKLGRVGAARSARDRFLADRPASHLAERMRRLCLEIE